MVFFEDKPLYVKQTILLKSTKWYLKGEQDERSIYQNI